MYLFIQPLINKKVNIVQISGHSLLNRIKQLEICVNWDPRTQINDALFISFLYIIDVSNFNTLT